MRFIYITRKSQSSLETAMSPPLMQTIPLVTIESTKLSLSQNCHFPFDDYHQNLTCQQQALPQTPSPTTYRSTWLFCQDAKCGPTQTDRQTDYGALQCIVETLRKPCGPLPNYYGSLRCIAVKVVHSVFECITHSWKCQNPIYLPYHPANTKSPQPNHNCDSYNT